MYLYSGYDIFFNPQGWAWAVPAWFAKIIELAVPLEFYLRMQGVLEFAVGFLLLTWFFGKWGVRIAAIFAVLEMTAILFLTGINSITFRDIGLLGAAFALLGLSFREKDFSQS